jgi:anti-sigma-K factor RskA/putative zinc finger protein
MSQMDSRHAEIFDLVAVYALGALGPEEARFISAHLAVCAECRAEYEAMRATADAVAYAADDRLDARDCARMKAELMAAVAATQEERTLIPRRSRGLVVTTVLALAAAIALAFISVNAQRQIGDLQLGGARAYAVPGGEVLKTAERVYLVMRTLPPPPSGRVYQAWTLSPGARTVKPSITFLPDARGFVVVSLPEPAAKIVAVAVSAEPPGGSSAPTTKPLFLRSL